LSLSPKQFQTSDLPQEPKPKQTGEVSTPHGTKKAVPIGPSTDELIEYGPKHHTESKPKESGKPVPRWALRNVKQFGLNLEDA
jgi:hypothetical protein